MLTLFNNKGLFIYLKSVTFTVGPGLSCGDGESGRGGRIVMALKLEETEAVGRV